MRPEDSISAGAGDAPAPLLPAACLPHPGHSPPPASAATRSASHIDLFALPGPELGKPTAELPAAAPVPPSAEQQQQQLAALKEAVQAKVVAAKQREAAELVAGVAAKYGLAADYGKAEQTIKAVWAEQVRCGVKSERAPHAVCSCVAWYSSRCAC